MNESISNCGVCRKAPATPGLLKIYDKFVFKNQAVTMGHHCNGQNVKSRFSQTILD